MEDMNDYIRDKEAWLVEDGYGDEEDEETPETRQDKDEDEDAEHEPYVGC